MTVLRSRKIAAPKTTPPNPKSKLKASPSSSSAPAQTHNNDKFPNTLQSPPAASSPSSQPQPQNPNPNFGSGSVVRRRSLRLASKSPNSTEGSDKNISAEKSGKANSAAIDDGTCSMAEEEEVVVVDGGIGGEIEDRVSNGEVGFDLFGKRVTVKVDEGLGELGPNCDLGKNKRKLEIDINFPASEMEGEDGGSSKGGFLNLRSGKKVAKRGIDGGGDDGEWLVTDLDTAENASVKSKVKKKLGERTFVFSSSDVVVLDSEDELDTSIDDVIVVESGMEVRAEENVNKSSSPSGKRKLSDYAVEGEAEDINDDAISSENGTDKGRRRYSSREKGKGILVEEPVLVLGNGNVELGMESEVLSSVDDVVPSSVRVEEDVALHNERQVDNSNARENVAFHNEWEVNSSNARENAADGNRYMDRFREIARRNASRFARFNPEEEEGNNVVNVAPHVEVAQDIQDWPGPFSTAMKIIKEREAKSRQVPSKDKTKPPLVTWVPLNEARPFSKNVIPSLQDLCLSVLAKNSDAIASLEHVADGLRHRLCQMLCDSRKMNSHMFELLMQGSPTEVRLRDCSWMTEEQFTESFKLCDPSNLTVLQLDQCGRCMPDYIVHSTLARSSKCLPALVKLSLRGACRLSDVGLSAILSSAPELRSLNLSQCALLSSSSMDTLANSLGSVLKELYLNDCQGIDAMHILPSLKRLEQLEVLSLAGVENVCDDFIREFSTACGYRLKELVLTDCGKLTDSSVKAIAETCSGLCALDLVNLYKLTDSTLVYLANGCHTMQTLKFCRNAFSDEAIAAFLETSGECLKELSLNNIKKVGNHTAISIAKRSRNLHTLDLSWCRDLTDETLGLIVDSCLSLKILKLFGCTQITNIFLDGHSNPEVRIIGLKVSPILEQVMVPDANEGPLRYTPVF